MPPSPQPDPEPTPSAAAILAARLVPNVPASTQPRSDLDVVLTAADQIPKGQEQMCDDLLLAMSQAHKVPRATFDSTLDEDREFLWKAVFDKRWNTNKAFRPPKRIPARTSNDSCIPVGTLRVDHPPPRKRKIKEGQGEALSPGSSEVPAHRRRGAIVEMKPNLYWDEGTVTFMLVDARGASIRPEYLEYFKGTTKESARAECMVNYDTNERARVMAHNKTLCVYWARLRLVNAIRQFPARFSTGNVANDDDATRPVLAQSTPSMRDEDLTELVPLETCMDVMEAWGRMKEHAKRMVGEDSNARAVFDR